MSWFSDPRTAVLLLSRASRLGGAVAPAVAAKIASLGGFLADDAAIFTYTARVHAAVVTHADDGVLAWIETLISHTARAAVWDVHRGAVLYLLECAAEFPDAWRGDSGRIAASALLDVAVREARERIALRNGVSFRVVEAHAAMLAYELAALPNEERAAHVASSIDPFRRLAREPWELALASVGAWRARARLASLVRLGVPFELACAASPPPGIRALAARFRAAAALDVTLYDSAPLHVPVVCLVRQWFGAQLWRDRVGSWDDRLLAALDHAERASEAPCR